MKKRKLIITGLVAIILFIGFLYFQNNALTITHINIRSSKLSNSFDGYRIIQLSDLHSKAFGEDQQKLLQRIKKLKPDLIVFTGDLVDSEDFNLEPSLALMKGAKQIAPVYFVTGNHEWWSGKFPSLEKELQKHGVIVLRNSHEKIVVNHDEIYLLGIDDPTSPANHSSHIEFVEKEIQSTLNPIKNNNAFKILLAHRPELFPLYRKFDLDLIFSGHAHGGQFRLPFIGGMIAPNQGLFPHYTAGKFVENHTMMIVNRGLGNSIIPQRIFNRPEIVVVDLLAD